MRTRKHSTVALREVEKAPVSSPRPLSHLSLGPRNVSVARYCRPGKINERLSSTNFTNCLKSLNLFIVSLLVQCMHCKTENPFRYYCQSLNSPCLAIRLIYSSYYFPGVQYWYCRLLQYVIVVCVAILNKHSMSAYICTCTLVLNYSIHHAHARMHARMHTHQQVPYRHYYMFSRTELWFCCRHTLFVEFYFTGGFF